MKNPLEIVKLRYPNHRIEFVWAGDKLSGISVDGKKATITTIPETVFSLLQYHDISFDKVLEEMLCMTVDSFLDGSINK